MNTVGVTDYTNLAPPKHFRWGKCLSSTPLNNEKQWWNVLVVGAHLQYVNAHYAKFEWKGMNTVGVTDYTNLAPMEKMSKFNSPQKWKKSEMCKKEEMNIFNMWTIIRQSLKKKEWKLLELQITQTGYPKSFGQTDGPWEPTTRPAFAKATKIKTIHAIIIIFCFIYLSQISKQTNSTLVG